MKFEYIRAIGRVLPVLDEGDPLPTDAEYLMAGELNAAVERGDPRVVMLAEDENGAAECLWRA